MENQYNIITLGYTEHNKPFIWLYDFKKNQLIKEIIFENNIATQETSESFRGGMIHNCIFYTCTHCEIVEINLSDFSFKNTFSDKSFNDLHDVFVDESGIYVANTGLDLVQHFSFEYELLREFNLMSEDTWKVFDKSVDYRFMTKMRGERKDRTHNNHIVKIDNEYYVTELKNSALRNLNKNKYVITDISGNPHDGILRDDKIYFTTTNGKVDIYSKKFEKLETIELTKFYKGGDGIGWCRGIEVVDDIKFIGFTKFRTSTKQELVKWIKFNKNLDSHILILDKDNNMLNDLYFDEYRDRSKGNLIIYGIYKYET